MLEKYTLCGVYLTSEKRMIETSAMLGSAEFIFHVSSIWLVGTSFQRLSLVDCFELEADQTKWRSTKYSDRTKKFLTCIFNLP